MLSILVTSGPVYLLRPNAGNVEKRVVKTLKLYFLDAGLAEYLTKWRTAEVLMTGAMSGAYFETFFYLNQFSHIRPGMPSKSSVFRVTRIMLFAIATAAIWESSSGFFVPFFC